MSEKNEVTRVNSEREKDFSFEYPQKPVTNGDRIRAMTNEELACFLETGCPVADAKRCYLYRHCCDCWLDWLKSPANEHGGDEK